MGTISPWAKYDSMRKMNDLTRSLRHDIHALMVIYISTPWRHTAVIGASATHIICIMWVGWVTQRNSVNHAFSIPVKQLFTHITRQPNKKSKSVQPNENKRNRVVEQLCISTHDVIISQVEDEPALAPLYESHDNAALFFKNTGSHV